MPTLINPAERQLYLCRLAAVLTQLHSFLLAQSSHRRIPDVWYKHTNGLNSPKKPSPHFYNHDILEPVISLEMLHV